MSKSSENIAGLLEMQELLHELMEREASVKSRGGPTPVIVEGKLFSHMIDAAHWLSWHRPQIWQNSKAAKQGDAYRVMSNIIKYVSRYCNNNTHHGEWIQTRIPGIDLDSWLLAEHGDPSTWENGTPADDSWPYPDFQDLRRK